MGLMICHNGDFVSADEPLFTAQNRSYKWGDGLFETIKVHQEDILLKRYHFERLFTGLNLLQMKVTESFNEDRLSSQILQLCRFNNCSLSARVRLAVYRKDNSEAGYTIEAIPLSATVNQWVQNGYCIEIYTGVKKSIDFLSSLKTANYLPYIMSGLYAKEKGLDDCLVLNSEGGVCDSSKANVFIIKNGGIITPALHQGCINGVMRRHIIETGKNEGYNILQGSITEEDLYEADEAFVTNAIIGVQWVKSFYEKEYAYKQTAELYKSLITPLYY